MKFSKDNQPSRRRKGEGKQTFSVRLTPRAIDYYRKHRGEASRVLEKNVKKED